MKNPKINFTEYEMEDGEYISMSTAPILMLKMRTSKENKKAYENMSRVLVNGPDEKDVMEVYEFLYATYLCANMAEQDDKKACMSFSEFVENANPDFTYNVRTVGEMVKPQKKPDSGQPS